MSQDKLELSIAIIIPVLNEEKAIEQVLLHIPKKRLRTVVVCDNGSTDKTLSVIKRFPIACVIEKKRGYGAACQKALSYIGDNADIIVFLDGDFSDETSYLEKLIRPIQNDQLDFVLGSRIAKMREKGAMNLSQLIGNFLVTRLIRLLYGYTYQDMGPFRAIRYSALKQMDLKDQNYGWNVEMQVKAIHNRLRIAEIPVPYRRRIGKSKISGTILGTLNAGTKMIYSVFHYGS